MNEKRLILDFIMNSDFSKAANPPKYIMKQYVRKTKSTVQWDDFLRIIKQLELEKHLEKSTGPDGEECYELTYNAIFVDEIEEREKLSFQKLKYDVKNAERVYKGYPLTRFLAWFGAASGAILLLLKLAELLGLLPKSK